MPPIAIVMSNYYKSIVLRFQYFAEELFSKHEAHSEIVDYDDRWTFISVQKFLTKGKFFFSFFFEKWISSQAKETLDWTHHLFGADTDS